jgi:hypothetical protein
LHWGSARPIVTVGQKVGRGLGTRFLFVGIPDGMGAYQPNGAEPGSLTLFVNHEFTQGAGGPAGPLPTGARVSNLTLRYNNSAGTEAEIVPFSGRYEIERVFVGDTSAEVSLVPAGFSRLCSAFLATERVGFDRPIFLHGEEDESPNTFDRHGGCIFATTAGEIYALPRMGRAAWENAVPVPGTGAKTVVFALEDGPSDGDGLNSQLYMYVGEKTPGAGDPITANGLNNGSLYVFKGDNPTRNSEATFNAKGETTTGHWQAISWYLNDIYFDVASREAGAFAFVRIEDGAPDYGNPGVFYFVTTGTPNSANPFGRLYRLNFNPSEPTDSASLTMLLDGTEGIVSPDNIDLNAHGELLVCEDPNYNLSNLGLTRDSSVWAYNINTTQLIRIAEIDRASARAHALAADPGNTSVPATDIPGGWETSGIIDAEEWFGRGAWLLNVQAHSLRIVPTDQTIQGGQIVFLRWLSEGENRQFDEKGSDQSSREGAGNPRVGESGAPAGTGIAPRPSLRISAAPNPFSKEAVIKLELSQDGEVEAAIYDATGRLVRTLIMGHVPAGSRSFVWDGRGGNGQPLASGAYFVEAKGLGITERTRLMLTR